MMVPCNEKNAGLVVVRERRSKRVLFFRTVDVGKRLSQPPHIADEAELFRSAAEKHVIVCRALERNAFLIGT